MHSEDRKNCKVADFVQFRTISLAYIKYFLYLCTRFQKCSFSRLEQPPQSVPLHSISKVFFFPFGATASIPQPPRPKIEVL